MEGNALKQLLRIPTRCHTTDIVDALNIEHTNRYLNRMKLKFLIHLTKNDLTREILNILIETNYENSFVSEIAKYLKLRHDYNLDSMMEYAKSRYMIGHKWMILKIVNVDKTFVRTCERSNTFANADERSQKN